MPIEYFGGEERFKLIQERDALKNKLIAEHPEEVKCFVRFNYMEKITEEYVREKIDRAMKKV